MTSNPLEDFFDELRANQRANRVLYPQLYSVIERLNDCFVRSGIDIFSPKPVVAGVLLERCEYAFKTAAGMALAGQVVEVCLVVRSMLECSGYCLLICEKPALEDVFLARHGSDMEMAAQKKAFTIKNVRDAIARHNKDFSEYYADLYQHTIDFGGHPNPHALFASAQLNRHEGNTYLKSFAISDDPSMIEFALKLTARSGLLILSVLYSFLRKDSIRWVSPRNCTVFLTEEYYNTSNHEVVEGAPIRGPVHYDAADLIEYFRRAKPN